MPAHGRGGGFDLVHLDVVEGMARLEALCFFLGIVVKWNSGCVVSAALLKLLYALLFMGPVKDLRDWCSFEGRCWRFVANAISGLARDSRHVGNALGDAKAAYRWC